MCGSLTPPSPGMMMERSLGMAQANHTDRTTPTDRRGGREVHRPETDLAARHQTATAMSLTGPLDGVHVVPIATDGTLRETDET